MSLKANWSQFWIIVKSQKILLINLRENDNQKIEQTKKYAICLVLDLVSISLQ